MDVWSNELAAYRLPSSVYYRIPLKHNAVHVSLPSALSVSEGYRVVISY
jgi:hypothetical protein